MKEPLSMTLRMTITDGDGKVVSDTTQAYAGMGEEHVVAVESRVIGELIAMGIEKLAVKHPEAADLIRKGQALGQGKS